MPFSTHEKQTNFSSQNLQGTHVNHDPNAVIDRNTVHKIKGLTTCDFAEASMCCSRQFVRFALAVEPAFTVAFGDTMWLMILDNRALAYTTQIDLSY